MERYHKLLLTIWREACRHIEIDELLAHILSLLSDALPMASMSLYHLDAGTGRVERLAVVHTDPDVAAPLSVPVEATHVRRLATWCRTASPVRFATDAVPHPILSSLVSGVGEFAIAVPLASEHGTLGLLFMGTDAGAFSPRAEQLAGVLREPLTVALENDRRLHELVSLREAAEADKRKLLNRLGREDLTDRIVGANGGLRSVMERVDLVRRSDVPVLILGETGSGKEVIARAIHEGSSRSGSPFIRVNCGAIPTELIDSELFGHERGSFTGAVSDRKGWFERADGGTLFLDEIGELPAAAQVRLLRVLQDGTFERVGGEKALHVNLRLIAATHRDLARMVQEGSFREDLWYRIAVFPVVLPPLRERKQDIPALAGHFTDRASRRFGLRPQMPSPDDIALLTRYEWPGNVRELSSVLDRAAILGDGERLEVAKALGVISPANHGTDSANEIPWQGAATTCSSLDEAMRRHIEHALRLCRGRIEGERGAAAQLKINPHTLRARMRKLGVDWNRFRE